eukprot:c10296_g1_i1 orf=172-993(+)
MEDHTLLPGSSRFKRKCDDSDAVLELLNGVSLSPHSKRLRQEFGSTSHFSNSTDAGHVLTGFSSACIPDIELYEQPPNDLQLCPPDIDLPEQFSEPLPVPPVNDERAIVLYKPVNPPLFPGGPRAGTQIMLNATVLSSGVLDASNLVRSRKDDELTWLREARNRTSIGNDSVVMEEEAKQSQSSYDNRLAVVPWVSNSPVNMLDLHTAAQTASQDLDNNIGDCLDVEAMEEDNEMSMDFVNSQPSNSNINFRYEPWQQLGVPQPQYGSIMSSH